MRLYGWFGLLLLAVSEYCLFHKIEPFYTWFYCFAWWSFILLADNLLLKLRGRSLLIGRKPEFWQMLPLSIFIWLIFESYNFIIKNWAYDGVPAEIWQRWPGYALAFATVLPGIFITSDLVELLFDRSSKTTASECEALHAESHSVPFPLFIVLGLTLCIAPLIWPRYFFPAVWLGFIFLLDPILHKLGRQGLLSGFISGNRRRVWSLLLGGLLCGMMWEFWNFWAASRWVYTVPFFEKWKIFEMPLLGFLGFPPFALECWVMYHLFRAILLKLNSTAANVAFWLGLGILSLIILRGIDQRTVIQFAEIFYWSSGPCVLFWF